MRAGVLGLLLACSPAPPDTPRDAVEAAPPESTSTADLARDCQSIRSGNHPQLGTLPFESIAAEIERYATGSTPIPLDDLALYREAAARATDQAEFELALQYLDRAADLLERFPELADRRDAVEFQRALVELRWGEEQNCTGETHAVCLFVPDPERGFTVDAPTKAAIERLVAMLDRSPDDLRARWLLNVAHMALRTYPQGVPERWRIAARAADPSAPRFAEIGHQLGVATSSLLGGAIMDDFDRDGYLDLFVTTYDPCESVRLYRNDSGGLIDVTKAAGLEGQLGGFNTQQTDFDNDGYLDIFITRGGWQARHGRHRNSLLRNRGDGSFEDVTRRAGLAAPAYPTQASAWADYDGDGDLDLYVGNEIEAEDPSRPEGAVVFPSQLFRNNGDGTFTDVARQAGVTNDRMAKGVAWGDIDRDGRPDLYVSNLGANRLYLNEGDGTFRDVAVERGVSEPATRSFATWFWDYDNDGHLDIFCAGYSARLEDVVADHLGRPTEGELPRLYRNDGKGGFEDVTVRVGLDRVVLPMGANFGDIDNDGWLDIYLGTGSPALEMQVPNVLFRNDRGVRFLDVTVASGTGHLPKGHGVAMGDLDNDFDQDLFVQAGGFVPGERQPDAFFLNPGGGGRAVAFDLVGTISNRAAIGARLELTFEAAPGKSRSVHRVVGSGSSFGANSLRVEVGTGSAEIVTRLRVEWPVSKTVQVFEEVAVGSVYRIEEGIDVLEALDLAKLELAP